MAKATIRRQMEPSVRLVLKVTVSFVSFIKNHLSYSFKKKKLGIRLSVSNMLLYCTI